MILDNFLFLDENSTATTSNAFKIPPDARELKLQVIGSGTVDVDVQGMTDVVGDEWADLGVVNASDLKTAESIAADGIYTVQVSGIKQVQVINNESAGSVRIFGLVVN